jgi:hypothetical protein
VGRLLEGVTKAGGRLNSMVLDRLLQYALHVLNTIWSSVRSGQKKTALKKDGFENSKEKS